MSASLEQFADALGGTLEHTASGAGSAPPEVLTDPRHPDYPALASRAVVVWSQDSGAPTPAPALLVVGPGYVLEAKGELPTVLRVSDQRLALARLSQLLDAQPRPQAQPAVHPDATLGADVVLAPGVVVGAGARLGAGCVVGANSVVGAGVILGRDCLLHANVTLYPGACLGDRVTVHSGAVIGADGFGYAAGPHGAEKIVHSGGVVLGDDVEVGANTAIDRGTLLPTRVGARTKIDNLCQIGHNVVIGSDTLIAGMTGVAGSVHIGSGVIIGGGVGVSDHVRIGDGARIAGRSGVTKDVPPGATWAGFPAAPHRSFVRERYLIGKLEQMWQSVKALPRDKGADRAAVGEAEAKRE